MSSGSRSSWSAPGCSKRRPLKPWPPPADSWLMRLVAIAATLVRGAFGQTTAEKQRASIALQRESVRKQAESLGIKPPVANVRHFPPPDCDAVAEEVVAPMIESAAKAQYLEAKLLRAGIARGSVSAMRESPVGA